MNTEIRESTRKSARWEIMLELKQIWKLKRLTPKVPRCGG